jgi:prevent-host-death family protein
MMQINIDEAQTHLSRLLLRVADGEEIVINRSGVPIAKLVPITQDNAREKSLVEQHVAESKEEIKSGQFFGPFSTAEKAIESLHENGKRKKKKTNKYPTR